MPPLAVAVIGLLTGPVHNHSYDFLARKLKVDDPVGAITVHSFCGSFGILSVALFGKTELLADARLHQFGIQLLGVVVCFAGAAGISVLLFKLLRATVGLRVSPQEEIEEISIGGHVEVKPVATDPQMSEDELRELMGG